MVDLELTVTACGETTRLRWSFAKGAEVCVIGYTHTMVHDLQTDMAGLMNKHASSASLNHLARLLRLSLDCAQRTSHAAEKCVRREEAKEEERCELDLSEETEGMPQSKTTTTETLSPRLGVVGPAAEAHHPDSGRVHSAESVSSILSDIPQDELESARKNSKMLIADEAEELKDSGDLGTAWRDARAPTQCSRSVEEGRGPASDPVRPLHRVLPTSHGFERDEAAQELRASSKDSLPSIRPDMPQDFVDVAIKNSKKLLPQTSGSLSSVARQRTTPRAPRTSGSYGEHRTSRLHQADKDESDRARTSTRQDSSSRRPSTSSGDQSHELEEGCLQMGGLDSGRMQVRRPRKLPHLSGDQKCLSD
eukprot:TRINITY_DN3055_c0_g1_i1.p1 TRINITY_DN3055_c0_g1~~TRINITY_DN3055_c0_g1_i1.p1  ORF type:complete len:364 (-),score=51.76 TRINITY_DN3055_c0_g1_i1:177-1268(-)